MIAGNEQSWQAARQLRPGQFCMQDGIQDEPAARGIFVTSEYMKWCFTHGNISDMIYTVFRVFVSFREIFK